MALLTVIIPLVMLALVLALGRYEEVVLPAAEEALLPAVEEPEPAERPALG